MWGARRSSQPGKASVAKGPDNVEVEESLGPLERALHFGTSKLSLQRLVCVHELVDGAHEIGYDYTVARLLPLVKQLATDQEVLVRQTLVGHFGDLAGFLIQSNPERGYQKVVDDILPIISSLLIHEKASEVRQGAADALITLASHLRAGKMSDQVLMSVIQLTHSNDDEDARSTAVQLLNSLGEALGQDLCEQFVCVELVALCEDPAFRVRKATASNFAEVARVIRDEIVLRKLLPAFDRLVHDQHWGVRKAAAESLVGLAMSMDVEKREAPLVPLMNDLLKDSSRWVRMSGLQQLGYFIAALENPQRVPADLLTQYVEIIEQTKANPDAADISYHCAYTFAAVTQTMGKECWNKLQEPFTSLCRDTQVKTRKAMAASIHIVAQTLGNDITDQEVLPQFETLLMDTADEVRLSALKNIGAVLKVVPKLAAQKRLLTTLSGSMNKAENNWRLRQLVASQIGPICKSLSDCSAEGGEAAASQAKDLTLSRMVPLLLHLCQDGVAEVRDEAAKSTARALRAAAPELFADPVASGTEEGSSGCSPVDGTSEPLAVQTRSLVKKLINTFARGKTFRMRMTYIRMCDSMIRDSQTDKLSAKPHSVFTDFLLKPLARLSQDKVKNVRLCWASTLLPHLRRMGRLGQTPGQNLALIAAAAKMAKEDADPEVRRILSGAQIVEPPEGADLNLGPESDLDESADSESNLCLAGGTGESSECSAEEVEEPGEASSTNEHSAVGASSAEITVDTSGSPASDSATEPVELPKAALSSSTSPKTAPVVPERSSPSSPSTMPLGFDPVEDSLISQGEIEKEIDAAFPDRRLFHEAELNPDFPSAAASALREERVSPKHVSPPSQQPAAHLIAVERKEDKEDSSAREVTSSSPTKPEPMGTASDNPAASSVQVTEPVTAIAEPSSESPVQDATPAAEKALVMEDAEQSPVEVAAPAVQEDGEISPVNVAKPAVEEVVEVEKASLEEVATPAVEEEVSEGPKDKEASSMQPVAPAAEEVSTNSSENAEKDDVF